MKQLTIRGFDSRLEQCLRELARERHLSLNRAALLLMRRGAGLAERGRTSGQVGTALDTFIGAWSQEQEDELLQALDPLDRIDPEMWG